MPPLMKAEDWQQVVNNLLRHVTRIDMPPETSPAGELIEHLTQFITERKSDESPEDMLRGAVYESPTAYLLRWLDLSSYLQSRRFTSLKRNEILAVMRTRLKGI
ncbi:hypothetical protein RZS08_51550, partial [Arthrospira platensis SPKY1]|nr:hypothetical protein [Arthrospira platensis SPKY1]